MPPDLSSGREVIPSTGRYVVRGNYKRSGAVYLYLCRQARTSLERSSETHPRLHMCMQDGWGPGGRRNYRRYQTEMQEMLRRIAISDGEEPKSSGTSTSYICDISTCLHSDDGRIPCKMRLRSWRSHRSRSQVRDLSLQLVPPQCVLLTKPRISHCSS